MKREGSGLSARRFRLDDFDDIVIKIGSSLFFDGSEVREGWLKGLLREVALLKRKNKRIAIVSSGAVLFGRQIASLNKPNLKLEDLQAAAAIGQIALSQLWSRLLQGEALRAAQILLTSQDTEERRRYLNARATIRRLFALNAVPVINENDTVASDEIRYGDNDRLAARVAVMIGADLLVLLSDVEGLFDKAPSEGKGKLVEWVDAITPQIDAMAGAPSSNLSRGGMKTKIEAGKIATRSGCAMVIGSGRKHAPLAALEQVGGASRFLPTQSLKSARKNWIGGTLRPCGRILVDAGAVKALKAGHSLLPAGVRSVEGNFNRGDVVIICGPERIEVGRGLCAYDKDSASKIVGLKSGEIEKRLGFPGRVAMIHRDDLVLDA